VDRHGLDGDPAPSASSGSSAPSLLGGVTLFGLFTLRRRRQGARAVPR
jgi:MYXO-CTERM domain-containing protein